MGISIKKDKKELLFETVKPMPSNELVSSKKVTFVENEKIITNDKEIAKVLTLPAPILDKEKKIT